MGVASPINQQLYMIRQQLTAMGFDVSVEGDVIVLRYPRHMVAQILRQHLMHVAYAIESIDVTGDIIVKVNVSKLLGGMPQI